MNGRQVAEAVRGRLRGLPVLFVTGYAVTPAATEVIGKRTSRGAMRTEALSVP